MLNARAENYNPVGAALITFCYDPPMDDEDKNGGPNHLAAWREYRGLGQAELAAKAVPPTTQGQIAHLESGRVGLSAKWLRRLAPALDTTPGMLLEHAPGELDADIIDIWATASTRQRRQIGEIARTILKTGTDD